MIQTMASLSQCGEANKPRLSKGRALVNMGRTLVNMGGTDVKEGVPLWPNKC